MTLRVVTDDDGTPLPYAEANKRVAREFNAARDAYLRLLTELGGPWAAPLFRSETLSLYQVRAMRRGAADLAAAAQDVAAHLAAATDAAERARAEPDEPE